MQGSRVLPALERAEQLLGSLPEDSARSILLISDGDFDEPGLSDRVAELAAQGIRLHVLGVGTEDGARVPALRGGWIEDSSGQPVQSVLNETLLETLADAGQGIYTVADYRDKDTDTILDAAAVTSLPPTAGDKRTRLWHERFYLLVLLVALILLPRFRGTRTGRTRV